jgi:hypothetical protein
MPATKIGRIGAQPIFKRLTEHCIALGNLGRDVAMLEERQDLVDPSGTFNHRASFLALRSSAFRPPALPWFRAQEILR